MKPALVCSRSIVLHFGRRDHPRTPQRPRAVSAKPVLRMSKSCTGMLDEYVACVAESECVKARHFTPPLAQHPSHRALARRATNGRSRRARRTGRLCPSAQASERCVLYACHLGAFSTDAAPASKALLHV